MQYLQRFALHLQGWIEDNIDFPFVLATVTETPRWTVVFIAIHEPLIIGVPLGVLLSFATSRAWRYYFESRDWRMLVFNILSIALAVWVITPVLFAMTKVPPHEVEIYNVLQDELLWLWVGALAVTTFLPLVQLAAVQGATRKTRTKPVETPVSFNWTETRYPSLPQPQRRTEVVSVANVPVHEPEHAADVRIVEDTLQVAQKETAIERNARLQAETVRKVEALHGLTADERRAKLLQMLRNGHANATQPELASIFDVSVSTISRDMSILQSQLN